MRGRSPGQSAPLLGLIVLFAAPALATPRVAVLVYAAPQAQAGPRGTSARARSWAEELRHALAERNIKALEGSIEQGLRANAERHTQKLKEQLAAARELLAEGRRLLSLVELEGAEAALREAEQRVEGALLLPEALKAYAEILRWRGVALTELGRANEAAEHFRRASTLVTAEGLTEADVRPDVAVEYRRIAQEHRERVSLQVIPGLSAKEGDPPQPVPPSMLSMIAVTIDGNDVPLRKAGARAELDVEKGEHVVTVRAPGYVPRTLRIVVDERGVVEGGALREGHELKVALWPDGVEATLISLRRTPSAAGFAALCHSLDLDSVLVAASGTDAGDDVACGQRFLCQVGGATHMHLVRADLRTPITTAAERLVAWLFPPAMPPGGLHISAQVGVLTHPVLLSPRPPPEPPPPRTPLYARPWLWVGAAVLTSGVLLGVSLWPRPQPTTTVLVDASEFALR